MQKNVIWTNGTVALKGEELWVVPFEENLLCKYNIKDEKMEQCLIWENAHCQVGSSYNAIKFNETIVVVPARENAIRLIRNNELVAEYNIAAETDTREHYQCSIVVGDKLLLFPVEENTIIEIHKDEMKKISCPMNLVSCAIVYDGNVLIANSSNCIWKYNVDTGIFEKIILDADMQVCWMGVWGEHIILSTLSGKLLLANSGMMNEALKIVTVPINDFFSTGIVHGNNLILFEHNDATNIWILNLTDMSMRNTSIEKDSFWLDWPYNAFGVPVEEQGRIYVMSPKHRALFILDEEGNVIERRHLFLDVDDEIRTKMIMQKIQFNIAIKESGICTFDNYLQCVIGN